MTALLLAAVELGGYINGFKLLPFVLLSLAWLKAMTWADKDADTARLPRETVSLVNLSLWIVGLLLALIVPTFWGALPVFLLFFVANVGVYLMWRKKSVGLKDLSQQFADWKRNLGKKKEKRVTASENAVVLIDRGGKPYPPPADDSPARPAYDTVQSVLQTPVRYGASRIDLRPVEGGAVVRYTVDGVTMEGKSIPKEAATSAIELIKQLAQLDTADRRKPQNGKIKITTEAGRHEVEVYTAGSTSGEMMKLTFDFKKQFDFRVDSLGLLSDQHKQVMATVAEPGGIVLLTAPDGQGQTNLAYAMLKQHDAFLSNIQTLERNPPIELEGITQNKISGTAPSGEETKQIDWMISQQPDVLFLDRCDDPRTAIDLAKYTQDGHRAYVAMRAGNTFDALAQWRKLIGDDTLAINSLRLIIAERLVRTLCEACKVAYSPEPEALKKMNMSPERVTKLFQPRKEPMRDQKGNEILCPFCQGMAYKGRTGVFELFRIDDEVRQAVQAGGTTNQFKGLFRKQKQRYLQEAALSRVEKGETSVEEVLRVLRGPSSGSSSRSAAALD
ncbi:MAG TPA: ATPase, T2SS/T4P/T4SS family [Tepidisphaeraceae bacterium]|jgi:type II secretory ATPase GspE/PulE/Tfp pilus assembly ATPase PilB-like protein